MAFIHHKGEGTISFDRNGGWFGGRKNERHGMSTGFGLGKFWQTPAHLKSNICLWKCISGTKKAACAAC